MVGNKRETSIRAKDGRARARARVCYACMHACVGNEQERSLTEETKDRDREEIEGQKTRQMYFIFIERQ